MIAARARSLQKLFAFLACLALVTGLSSSLALAASLPEPAVDETVTGKTTDESIVLSGGCFWGVQAVFQHFKGVKEAVSGYSGGEASSAHYDMVSTGTTGHAEAVKITYDPSQLTLGKILEVFFAVAHDPTELNFQGPDHGSQYRSAIFFSTPEQQKIAEAYVAQLDQAKAFSAPIVTKIVPINGFYAAEEYHQNYFKLHPYAPYIVINDAPKVAKLQKLFPDLYVSP
ncbi:MAG: peptide-methionine (S)-S-oxide reductase MsrA [Pseudomonadota bacterium]|nr:peptide-methionine (S)-S-oxide reductase MsrA [Pseudomonadota bacterium]